MKRLWNFILRLFHRIRGHKMASYKQVLDLDGSVSTNTIQRVEDSAFIPNDPNNRDWMDYQVWAQEHDILPPDPLAVALPDPNKEILLSDQSTTEQKLDALIKILGFK